MERLIFHVDVNGAYLSWEAARRVARGEKDLRLIPSAIGGDREKRTGVVLAKSVPAKKFGVKTGEPVASALRKCPHLYLAQPDFALYERCSEALMDLCRKHAPVVEEYSIDECFLDMTGAEGARDDPVATAIKIKNAIREELGFTVNVGVGSNKLLAKMASNFEKPDRVHTLFSSETAAKLWPLPVGELFTVGRATAERLHRARIFKVGDLAAATAERIQALVGEKFGLRIHNFARGLDDSPVLAEKEAPKGYSSSTTLDEDVRTMEAAREILLALADRTASRIRADGAEAFCVAVTIRDNDFKDRSRQRKLPDPTDITAEVFQTACALYSELWDRRTPLRLLGISLTSLAWGGRAQQCLFPDERREREKKLDRAVDAIRRKLGADAILPGALVQSNLDVGLKHKARLEGGKGGPPAG